MWQCRKIYANLLLLSVLLFALGASATPRFNRGASGQTVWSSSNSMDFRWDCSSGRIVYRGQQITAVVGGELNFLLPEKVETLFLTGAAGQDFSKDHSFDNANILQLPQGRAPPVI